MGIGQVGALLLSFASSLIFARFLSAETYGTYRYLSSIVAIISLFSLTGLGTALTQAVASGKEGTIHQAFRTQLRWSCLMSLVSLGLGGFALWQNNTVYFLVFLILAVTGPLSLASNLYDPFLAGQGKFRTGTIYYLITNFLTSLFLLVAAFSGRFFLILFPFQYILQTILGLIFYFRVAKTVSPKAIVDDKAVSYGKRLSLIYIITTIADQADNIILFLLAGPVNLAIYSFAVAIPDIIKGFLKTITPLSLPKLTAISPTKFRLSLPIRLFQITVLAGFVIFAYVFAAPFIFKIFFPAYQNAIVYSQIFVLSLFVSPYFLLIAYFQAKKMVKQIFLINIVPPIFQIFLMIGLTYFWGLPGLIGARILGRIFNLFFSFSLVSR